MRAFQRKRKLMLVVYKDEEKRAENVLDELMNAGEVKFCKDTNNIGNGQWNKNSMQEVCPLIQKWKC